MTTATKRRLCHWGVLALMVGGLPVTLAAGFYLPPWGYIAWSAAYMLTMVWLAGKYAEFYYQERTKP